jgi:formylglycine-generating enzyme required for sulfatase activity
MWAQADEYCKVQGKRLPSERSSSSRPAARTGGVYPWGDTPPTSGT